jgi:hypothetical protein
MSFTGLVPTSGSAGVQCGALIDEIEALGVMPENMKQASEECRNIGTWGRKTCPASLT